MEQYKYPTDPVNETAVIQGERHRFTVLFDGLVRCEWAPDGHFEDRPSIFAINRNFPRPNFKVTENNDVLEIDTSRFHLVYAKSLDRFSPNSLGIQVKGAFAQWGTTWKFGVEDAFRSNIGGTARTLDGADGGIVLEDGVLSRRGYAEINDSSSMLLEETGWVGTRRPGDGRVDTYIFAYGLDFRTAIKALYSISGPQPSLPRWALGNWWSRFYRYSAESYIELMEEFKRQGIPLSIAVIDMDWHKVSSPEVLASGSTGWTGYSWNPDLFPNPLEFLKSLHDNYKLKVTLNDHPADGIHNFEDSYQDMAKALSLDAGHGNPIEFDPTSPAFFKVYLQLLHRRLEKDGVDFWWIDWQQGSYSRIPGVDPLWLLNHFHFVDQKLFPPPMCPSAASRPMIFSRYAGPGSHRYPVGFSGDTITTWASLDFQPYFTLTASNIGYGWWSHDIGGHMYGARDDELVTRWTQLGCMSPVLRLHSSDSPWSGKEPWGYGGTARDVMIAWLRFRHRLVPYVASVNFAMGQEGERHSMPLVQPMYWDYPTEEPAYDVKNQYTFGGSNLIVAPITSPVNAKTQVAKAMAWIPPPLKGEQPSKWIDILTGLVYASDKCIAMYRSLSQYPVLAKEGTIIPLDKAEAPDNGCGNPSGFEILVIIGRDARFDILEEEADDQDQLDTSSAAARAESVRSIPVTWSQETSSLSIGPSTGSSSRKNHACRSFSIRFLNVTEVHSSNISTTFDHKPLSGTSITVQKPKPQVSARPPSSLFSGPATIVTLPPTPFPLSSAVTVSLSPKEPSQQPIKLDEPDPLPPAFQFIQSSQLNFDLKSRLWEVVSASGSTATLAGKLARLNAVEVGGQKIVATSTGDVHDGRVMPGHAADPSRDDVLGPIWEILGGPAA